MTSAAGAIEVVQQTLREAHEHLAHGDVEMARDGYFEALDLVAVAGLEVDQGSAEHHMLFILAVTCRMSFASTFLDEDAARAEEIYRSVDETMRGFATAVGISDLAENPYAQVHANALGCLAIALEYQYKLAEARAKYELAIDIFERAHVSTVQYASILESYADLLRKHGDLDRALELLERARSLVGAMQDDTSALQLGFNVTLHLGQVYADRQQFERARSLFIELLEDARAQEPDSRLVAVAHGDLGRALYGLDDFEGARAQWTEALRLHELRDPSSDEVARTVNALGELAYDEALQASGGNAERFKHSPQLRLAARHFERALAIRSAQDTNPEDLGMVLYNAGVTRELHGDAEGSRECFEQALELYRQAPPNIKTARVLTGLAKATNGLGRPDEAIEMLREAIGIVESLRARAGWSEARERFFGSYQEAYETLIAYLFERGEEGSADEAFQVAERSRARVLVELLAERAVEVEAQTDKQRQLLDERASLQRRRAELYELRREQLRRGLEFPQLRHESLAAAAALEGVERRIRAEFPVYAEFVSPDVAGAKAAQALLGPDTLLLEYATGTVSFAWAFGKQGRAMIALPASDIRIRELVAAAVGHYQHPDRYDRLAAGRAIAELSTVLLGEIPEEAFDGVARLVVVPDGALHYLPFELLVADDGALLGDRYAISYAPSATALESLHRNWRAGPYRLDFVGFGDPAFEAPRDAPLVAPARFAGLTLSRLKGSGDEVRAIAGMFGERGAAYVREEATEHRAKTECEGARFVHFATHGVVADDEPLYSGLALAPPRADELRSDPHLDDMLQTYEMFSLPLSAEAVVCSACQTALGRLHDGEGMIGMTRALFFAGARCAVVSLWPVDDLATSALMQTFYCRIRDGLPVADALRQARTATRREWPDPRDWAAFVVVGLGS